MLALPYPAGKSHREDAKSASSEIPVKNGGAKMIKACALKGALLKDAVGEPF